MERRSIELFLLELYITKSVKGVVYQIYPASYKDSNNDGVGDIPGIISKLDYIQSIGVDILWVCPMYDSHQIDMGK